MFLFTTYLLSNVFAKTECETGTHMFNEECLPDNPCQSDECWTYDSGECKLRKGADPRCSVVDCTFDKMIISYDSYLFGNRVGDGIKKIHAENQPSFNEETGLWTVECIIGECGMILTSDQDKKEIVMRVDLESDGEEYNVDEQEQGILTSAGSVISYECRYPKEFQLITKSVKIVDEDEFNGDFKSRGDLNDGFELSCHTDDSLTGLNTEIFLGKPLYIEAKWNVPHKTTNLKWMLKECDVIQDVHRTAIIKNNCYAEAIDAMFLSGGSHLVTESSVFCYNTFAFTKDRNAIAKSSQIECSVEFCIEGEDCDEVLEDASCPTEGEDILYEYSAFGAGMSPK